MNKSNPLVSVIVITYNEGEMIARCLSQLRDQTYSQNKIELIVVDDDSSDNTIEIVGKFGAKIVRSGFKNCEKAKSIGIKHAKGKYILFLDADVFLKSADFIEKSVALFEKYPSIVGVQPIRWHYKRDDFLVNRYCNLFGINNPLVLFLGKRGVLMATDDKWFDKKVIKRDGDYFSIVKFSPKNLPTLGSIGYMARKEAILKATWKPYFFHLDNTLEMVNQGMNRFALTTLPVEHDFAHSLGEYHSKLCRNMYLFLKYGNYRKYDYDIKPLKLIFAVVLMITLIYPLYQSFLGYIKKRDIAWFLHPVLCMTIPFLYLYVMLLWKVTDIHTKKA